MNRTICIPNINEGKSFEVPERETGDRIKMLKAMKSEPKELLEDKEYCSTMEGAYLGLYVLQHKFPDLTIDDIFKLPDSIDAGSLFHLKCIVSDSDFEKIRKEIKDKMKENTDFRQPKTKEK